jgi:segregation and condensation protein A
MTVAISPAAPVTLADYQLRLPAFEGPLDLLLRLIEKAELPIAEVSLVAVTDQFLAHVRELGGIEAEALADFTAIGARLVLLKSRSLLPRPPAQDEDEEEDDLVFRLREYQAAKEAARLLSERHQTGERSFARVASVTLPRSTAPARLAPHQPLSLVRALRRRLSTIPAPMQLIDGRERIPIRALLERALSIVRPGRRWVFTDIVNRSAGREETMTAFLAVLVLVRRRVFDADQTTPFGDIELWRTADAVPALTELVPPDTRDEE